MTNTNTESQFEETTLDRLKALGYRYQYGYDLERPSPQSVVLAAPLRDYLLMQAIAHVNRIFRDKPGGLIVDYIGIDDRLKEATRKYSSGGGRGSLTDELEKEALDFFKLQLQTVRANMPALAGAAFPPDAYANWRSLSNIQLEDFNAYVYGTLINDPQHKDDFLDEEYTLSNCWMRASLPGQRWIFTRSPGWTSPMSRF